MLCYLYLHNRDNLSHFISLRVHYKHYIRGLIVSIYLLKLQSKEREETPSVNKRRSGMNSPEAFESGKSQIIHSSSSSELCT